jgi:uncharacterized protein YegP (UPF0339 family)
MPAGLAIGLWIGTAVFLAFPISGGSLNPARTLGPDIVSTAFPYWWIYIIGPLAGGALGGWIGHFLKKGRNTGEAEQGEDEAGEAAEPQAEHTGRAAADDQPAVQRPGKFVLHKGTSGKYQFSLVAANGQVIATGAEYERRQTALSGIESVRKNAPAAEVDNQTGE